MMKIIRSLWKSEIVMISVNSISTLLELDLLAILQDVPATLQD